MLVFLLVDVKLDKLLNIQIGYALVRVQRAIRRSIEEGYIQSGIIETSGMSECVFNIELTNIERQLTDRASLLFNLAAIVKEQSVSEIVYMAFLSHCGWYSGGNSGQISTH